MTRNNQNKENTIYPAKTAAFIPRDGGVSPSCLTSAT